MSEQNGMTAGPWHVEGRSGHYEVWPKDEGQTHTAICDRVFRQDDARVIAALPELVEALRGAVEWHRQTASGTDSDIAGIYGQETLALVKQWEALLARIAAPEDGVRYCTVRGAVNKR